MPSHSPTLSSDCSSQALLKVTSLTWNVEGLKRNKFALKYFIDLVSPDFIFLNETLLFQFESILATDLFHGEYCHELNSDDKHDPELPFIKNRSSGGTMILWKIALDKFVTVLPTETSSFLAVLFHPPGSPPSVQISLYLPTSGLESDFIEEISKLRMFLDDLLQTHPDYNVYIRGDSNVNNNNKARVNIFDNFKDHFKIISVPTLHKTYHHFLGGGLFDSDIDVIMHLSHQFGAEEIENVYCKTEYPIINSHHDVIFSNFSLPIVPVEAPPTKSTAPVIPNVRKRIVWNDENLTEYRALLGNNLVDLRERWALSSSRTCVSLLLQQTYEILSSAASATNKSLDLSCTIRSTPAKVPRLIKSSQNILKRRHRIFTKCLGTAHASSASFHLKRAKANHRRLIRQYSGAKNTAEDQRMSSLLSSTSSSSVYRKIKSIKSSSFKQIPFLKVGTETFHGEDVKDGFFESISKLKMKEPNSCHSDTAINQHLEDYKHILDICKNKVDLPRISLYDSTKILKSMKAHVNDFYSLTPAHFIHAGESGSEHFNFLLNCIIEDTNNATIEELNSCYALLLHKGHGKERTIDKAYRTISTCPLLSKAIDLYIRDLHKEKWTAEEASTQYQGEGSCHELAALLVSEVIQHSVWTLKEPAYLLFMDAKSAFDKVVPEMLIRNLYKAGMNGNTINFIDHRLKNRLTYIDWDKNLMGPIRDEHGVEQGGINSSDYYKIYSNENLNNAQKSSQGIDLGNSLVISEIGLADDTVACANKLTNLSNILHLVNDYCRKYSVTLCHEKTKLIRFTKNHDTDLEVYNPIFIDGQQIVISNEAEHVGVLRSSTQGNIPHLMNRICSHRKALGATLSSGVAQRNRANPLVGLKLEKVYGSPVLLSGVASLVLLGSETSMLDRHLKDTYSNIQKLHKKTPESVVYFLGGCLPGEAVIHLRMLTLFGMVARLHDDPLKIHARNVLVTAKSSSKSWFCQLRNLCLIYQLPHPIVILDFPPNREAFKKLIKSRVVDYWERKLRGEALLLPSLLYFKPEYMSLTRPHPIWSTAGSNPYEVSKAVQQARFLSGRYRSEYLSRHWTSNKEGYCLSPTCNKELEDVEHILIHCKAYRDCKSRLYSLWLSSANLVVKQIVIEALSNEKSYLLQFIIDCSVLPSVIKAVQAHGHGILDDLFYLTRTWCFSIHRQRMKMLGRWNFQ